MRHLYLSEVKEFINNCGVPKECLKQFRIASSKSSDAMPNDLKHTLVALEKSKHVYMYISRYMGKSVIGIRLYPKDTYVIHNDCPLEEVFAGCSEMNNVDGLMFWEFLADDNNSDGSPQYHECPREFFEKLLEPTAATADDIPKQNVPVQPGKVKRGKETQKKPTSKIKKTARPVKKASIVDITLDEIKKSQKQSNKPEPDEDTIPILQIEYDESKYPTELVERYVEFYGLNPVELEAEHGIKAVIKTMYDNQGSKESMETAVGLYNLLAAHSTLSNVYNRLHKVYNDYKEAHEEADSSYNTARESLNGVLDKYCGHIAYYKKQRRNLIGKLGSDIYTVDIFKIDDTEHKKPVKRYITHNKKDLTIGSILNETGIYVTCIIER